MPTDPTDPERRLTFYPTESPDVLEVTFYDGRSLTLDVRVDELLRAIEDARLDALHTV